MRGPASAVGSNRERHRVECSAMDPSHDKNTETTRDALTYVMRRLDVAGKEIAEKTGISATLILEWVNLTDLCRVKGIGEEYADLLEEAGVDTVPELAQRNAENLHQKLVEINDEKELVRRVPTSDQVKDWVEQAKQLPRVVTY